MNSIKSNTLFPAAAILTVSIAAMCILTQIVLTSSLKNMRSDTRIIRLAENQRALSQQIVAEIAADNLGGILAAVPVDTLTVRFLRFHRQLLYGDSTGQLPSLDNQFTADYVILDTNFQQYYRYIGFVANADNNSPIFIKLLQMQTRYLNQLDRFIHSINGNSEKKISNFQTTEIVIMLASLAIIGLEVVFILFPAIRRLNRQNRQLKAIAFNQSHIVRQPLANIQGLIQLIRGTQSQAIKDELLLHVYGETEKLNRVIIETVSTATQSS